MTALSTLISNQLAAGLLPLPTTEVIMIRLVQNKNASLTVYVPAKYAQRFQEALRAGVTDILEAEMDNEEAEEWLNNMTWEYR
jgi:hypothetical protein